MSSPDVSAFLRPEGARPFVLGHRGARHGAPENTHAAFELAAREGADGVELDVRLDGSGNVIVLHDVTLERVSKGAERRAAEDLSSEELGRVDVGQGERVPLLADVLEWARDKQLRVNVELKSDVRRRHELLQSVAHVLQSMRLPPVILSSFSPAFVLWLAYRLPTLPVAWLVHDKQRLLKFAPGYQLLGATAVHPQLTIAMTERMRMLRGRVILNVWTVNDPNVALELASFGVDGIISDVPGKILAALTS